MTRFILRRILETVPLLLFLSLLVFGLFQLIPGDYLTEMELNPTISSEQVRKLRQEFGLREPFYKQYFIWVGQLVQGNFGYSFSQRRPAVDLIGERLTNTLILTAGAALLILLISLPLGIVAALNAGGWLDRTSLILSLLGLCLPSVLASILFLYFAFWTGWFPLGGTGGIQHLVLPSMTLALPVSAFLVRNLRLEMIEALRQPYVVAAAARGLPSRRVIYHASETP